MPRLYGYRIAKTYGAGAFLLGFAVNLGAEA